LYSYIAKIYKCWTTGRVGAQPTW